MPTGTGTGTESYTWNTETEWQNGTFNGTTTDGAGALQLPTSTTIDFSYTLDSNAGGSGDGARATIYDSAGNIVARAEVSGVGAKSGTFSVDTSVEGDELEMEVRADNQNDPGAVVEASISTAYGYSVSARADSSSGEVVFDSLTKTYTYGPPGSYTTPTYSFSEVTTASSVLLNSTVTGGNVTVDVYTGGDVNTASVSASGGSESLLVDAASASAYYLVVSLDPGSDPSTTPTVDSLGLETHTPPTNHSVDATRSTEVDLSWQGVSVSDGYEVYQSTSTPVTTGDTLAFDTTSAGTTSTTITGLDQGTTYYFNVRAQYSGE